MPWWIMLFCPNWAFNIAKVGSKTLPKSEVVSVRNACRAAPTVFSSETLVCSEEKVSFDFCIFVAITAVNGIGVDALCK